MPTVVVTDSTFPDVAQERAAAEAQGCAFNAHQCRSAEEVAEAIDGATVAAVQFAPVTREAIARLAPGAAIIRYGIGYDNIDIAAARELGVPVGYVPDYCTEEVAEHTCASLLALLRKLPALDASVRAGRWEAVAVARPVKPFAETLVGFFGFGQIGRAVHARLAGFGFRFAVSDPALEEEDAAALGLERLDAAALFERCDAVCLHAPANARTNGIINATTLGAMPRHGVIVNAARGSLVDETALAAALEAGEIGGAALDVFTTEPLPADSPLRDAPNLMLSPHAAWYSEAAIDRLQGLVADDITRHLAGKALRKPVPG